MANEFEDILKGLAQDISAEAKITLDDARRLLLHTGPLALQWEQQARAAEAAGETKLAQSKRKSIEAIKHAAVLEIATHSIIALDKVERAILAAFDRAISMIP